MGAPIDRTAKTTMDANLVNGTISDAPKLKASDNIIYDYVDGLNQAQDAHAQAATLAHPDGSVKTAKIADGAVTEPKYATGSVSTRALANGSVGPSQLQAGLSSTVDVNAQFAKRGIDVTSAPYNAKGDGVTDDTASIQAAIDAITALGSQRGGVLYFPPGTYLVSSLLTLPYGCIMRGAGRNGTKIKSTVASGYTIAAGKYTVIEDLQIDGTLSTGSGLDITNPIRKPVFSRIAITDFVNGKAIHLDNAYDTNFYSCEILRCSVACEITANNNNDIAFYSCSFVDIYSEVAIPVTSVVGLSFYNCSWGHVGATDTGTFVELTAGSGVNFISNWFEWGYRAFKNIGASNINFSNNHCSCGVETVGGDNVFLQQNDFYGNGGTIQSTGTTTNVISVMNVNRDLGIPVHTGSAAGKILKINQDKIENAYGTVLTNTGMQIAQDLMYKFVNGGSLIQYSSGAGKGNMLFDVYEGTRDAEITFKNSHATYKLTKFNISEGNIWMYEAGKGLIVTTPDGTKTYRIAVDNAGAITSTLIP